MSYERRDDYEVPCTECLSLTRVVFLVDARDMAPCAGLVCPDCEDRLIAELHDDEGCRCGHCTRAGGPRLVLLPPLLKEEADDVGF